LIIEQIRLLASPSEQLAYERTLAGKAGHAPSEIVEMFCSLFHPKWEPFIAAFSSDELRDLAHLYGLIVEACRSDYTTVSEMLKDPKWRRVVELAKELSGQFRSAT
jgi:hypothetical protein